MEQFVKLSDVRDMLDNATGHADIEQLYAQLKVYKAEYKPYMPIRIRDYGYTDGVHEYDCGADGNHHWLQIEDDGRLRFINMQCCAVTLDEKSAKICLECCFVPTYEHTDEFGNWEGFITPSSYLVIEEDREENA